MKQVVLMLVLTAVGHPLAACGSEPAPAPHAPTSVNAEAARSASPGTPAAVAPAGAPLEAAGPELTAESDPALAIPGAARPPATDEAAFFPSDVVLTTGDAWIAPAGRSPLGNPGETTPTAALRLGEVGTVTPTAGDLAAPVIAWDQAHRHLGETITVEGRIVSTHRSKSSVVFLNFDRDWKGKFYVPVFRDAYRSMPVAAETFFLNQTVRVTGEVKLFNGAPNIAVNQLSQITVVSGRAPGVRK